MNDPAIKRQENNPPHRKYKLEQLKQLLDGDPKEVLEELHLKQGLSQKDIAHCYHKHPHTISRWFKSLGIATIRNRPKTGGSINSEVRELVLGAIKKGSFEKLPQRAKYLLSLRYLQIGTPLTLDEIAKKMGGISRQRVSELEKTMPSRKLCNEMLHRHTGETWCD